MLVIAASATVWFAWQVRKKSRMATQAANRVQAVEALLSTRPKGRRGGDLRDGALDVGAEFHVVLAQPGAGSPVGAGGAQQAVMLVQDEGRLRSSDAGSGA